VKTLEITKATKPLSDYAKQVDRETVVVVRKGKPLAVLSSAKGMDAESIALANSPKFARIIQKSRARHRAQGGVSIDEMRRQLGIAPRKQNSASAARRKRQAK